MSLSNEQIVDAIAGKTLMEVMELVKAIEEKFGVTAAAPVAVAVAAGPAAVVEEQVVAVLLPADGGGVAGDLGRGEDDVVVRFAADGHRGGEGHHPVLLAILADDQSGHGVAVCW